MLFRSYAFAHPAAIVPVAKMLGTKAVPSALAIGAMEFDSVRAGGFEPLRLVPRGKRVVLGLISSKSGALESGEDVKRRIDEAAKFVPLEDLCLSPQCGFSSTHHGNLLTEDEQWRKLELVVEVAADVWR